MVSGDRPPTSDRLVDLLLRYWLAGIEDRIQILNTGRWSPRPSPASIDPADEAYLRLLASSHVHGTPPVRIHFTTRKNPDGWISTIKHVRLGASYVPRSDDTCTWGGLDLDGTGGGHTRGLADPRAAARAIAVEADHIGLPVVIESSASTTGYHVWIFFAEPQPRESVRNLLFGLVDRCIDVARHAFELADGVGHADPMAQGGGVGIEVFPKLRYPRSKSGTGNTIWAPFWHGTKPGGCRLVDPVTLDPIDIDRIDDPQKIHQQQMESLLRTLGGSPPAPEPIKKEASAGTRAVFGLSAAERAKKWIASRDPAIQGQGGDIWTFQTIFNVVVGFGLTDEDALDVLRPWNSRCQPPWNESDLLTKFDSARASAPHKIGFKLEEYAPPTRNGATTPSVTTVTTTDSDSSESESESPKFGTESWFADLLVRMHGDDLRYVHRWGSWVAWRADLGIWDRVEGFAEVVRRSLLVRDTFDLRISSAETKPEKSRWTKAAEKYGNYHPILRASKIAQTDARVSATVNQWDAENWLLNVRNGTIDLRTGELRPHNKSDYQTKRAAFAYDPDAGAPRWEAFVSRVLPDPDLRHYVHRACGYFATGLVCEDVLHIFYGSGSNGKSTLIENVMRALGEYADAAMDGLLLQPKGERHPTEQADLFGLRLVTTSESPEGGKLNEALVKKLTGGDRVKARGMHEDPWSFDSTHKLVLSTNHKPEVTSNDYGIWRRLRLVPFTTTFSEDELDKGFRERIGLEEGPGILRWIVEGAKLYASEGLDPCQTLLEATEEYRDAEDSVRSFIRERLRIDDDRSYRIASRDMHAAYEEWCEEVGIQSIAARTLTNRLKTAGLRYLHSGSFRGFVFVRFAVPGEDDPIPVGTDEEVTHRW